MFVTFYFKLKPFIRKYIHISTLISKKLSKNKEKGYLLHCFFPKRYLEFLFDLEAFRNS